MADVQWTKAQQDAIAARNCRLLVAAAAGSGKTAVLVERIIERILDLETGVDIDRLMVVTYTEAAASEMRERLGKGLANRMADLSFDADPKLRKRLKRQLTLLNKATISTMHAFCSKIIRKNFNKIDLDPNFRVLDGVESDLLKDEAVEQLLEELYEGTKEVPGLSLEAFENLLDIYGGKQEDGGLKALILHVHQKTSANPFPKQWRDEHVEAFSPEALAQCRGEFCNTLWGKFVTTQLQQELPYWLQQCRKAIEFCEDGENPAYIPALTYFESYFQTISEVMESENRNWDDIQRAVQSYSLGRLPNKTAGCDAVLQEKAKEIIDDMKNAVAEYRDAYFAKNTEENLNELSQAYPILKDVCRLVDAFVEVYGEKKRLKGGLDYDDLEHFALTLLTAYPEVAAEMQDFYEEVYIDEYQDANMTQETILSLVIRQKPEQYNLFMVGDIKQSIYGFRQARPDIFLGKYQTFSQEEGAAERLILLDQNFRSRKNVLGSVNYLFPRLMTKEVGGMDYTRAEYLYYGAKHTEPAYDISCELLLSDTKEVMEEEIPEKSKQEMEATMIGKRIQALLAEAGGTLQYKDIVILLRAKTNADVYQETLEGMGIPVFCDVSAGFYQSKEGKLILALLQIIDNPLQDIPFLAVMKSPVGGFTESEIAVIRLQNRNQYLYYNVKARAEAGDEKTARFLEQLSRFRTFAVDHDLSELLLELYRKTDYYNYAGVFADGQQRQANLQKIYEEAVKYETQTGGGIFEFLAYVERIRSGDSDLGGATLLGENDNVVRIMSIHKSKGLEFPVVFLANMDKGFNRKDFSENLLIHQELGFGIDMFDREYRLKWDTISKFVMKCKKNQELIAEEIRLLYVAMTRAKEKLILSGLVANVEKTFQRYWDVISKEKPALPFRYAMKAKSYFDLVLPVLLRHPDLQDAREAAEITNNPLAFFYPGQDEECSFRFRLISKEELCLAETEATSELTESTEIEATDIAMPQDKIAVAAEVNKRLSATYAFAEATELPAKISVSQLNHKEDLPTILPQPRFMEGKRERSAAEWGTITHYILQYIPLDDVRKETVQALCRKQGLTEEEAEAFPWERIAAFFQSGVGQRMRNALRVYREKPFTMEVPASRLFAETAPQSQDTVLVQGIIDCYFEEADGVVILDYKTDRVLPGKAKEAAEAYRLQLDLYQLAVEAELGKPVKEKMICFLQTGEFVVQ